MGFRNDVKCKQDIIAGPADLVKRKILLRIIAIQLRGYTGMATPGASKGPI